MANKELGTCEECRQMIYETPWGSTPGHLPNCSKNPDN